jgi:hypothetical protein
MVRFTPSPLRSAPRGGRSKRRARRTQKRRSSLTAQPASCHLRPALSDGIHTRQTSRAHFERRARRLSCLTVSTSRAPAHHPEWRVFGPVGERSGRASAIRAYRWRIATRQGGPQPPRSDPGSKDGPPGPHPPDDSDARASTVAALADRRCGGTHHGADRRLCPVTMRQIWLVPTPYSAARRVIGASRAA